MIEIISKLSGVFKVSVLPLFFLVAVHHPAEGIAKEEKRPEIENTAPGDNFPYAVISRGI